MSMSKIRRYIPLFLCIAFFVICSVVCVSQISSREAALQEQSLEIAELKNKLSTLKVANENAKTEYHLEITGVDMNRVKKDDNIISNFMRQVCTWDSYDEYMSARVKIMQSYGIEEDSAFMSIFMPVVVNRVSPDGKNYNRIDTMGLNMTYEGLDSYVTKIVAGDYSYFTIVTVSSTWVNGGEALATAAVMYTVDAEGNLKNISAIPLD